MLLLEVLLVLLGVHKKTPTLWVSWVLTLVLMSIVWMQSVSGLLVTLRGLGTCRPWHPQQQGTQQQQQLPLLPTVQQQQQEQQEQQEPSSSSSSSSSPVATLYRS
jgi:hypothetical protein